MKTLLTLACLAMNTLAANAQNNELIVGVSEICYTQFCSKTDHCLLAKKCNSCFSGVNKDYYSPIPFILLPLKL
ncbi:hypothetical protein [Mucilaginibacter sp. HD30]